MVEGKKHEGDSEEEEAENIFGRLKEIFGRNREPTAFDNRSEAFERCRDNILRIHRRVIVISGEDREKGLEDVVISTAAIDGLCDRIVDCHDYFSKAAVAIDYIANFHPFLDGNKRTSLEVAIRFLILGGYELDDSQETYMFIRDVASGVYDREEIEVWLKLNSHLSSL